MDSLPSTGEELRRLRVKAGIPLLRIAERMGNWESGLSMRERSTRPLDPEFVLSYLAALRDLIAEDDQARVQVRADCDRMLARDAEHAVA